MKLELHPRSVLIGFGVAVLALVAMGQKGAADVKWEFQVVDDVDAKEAERISKDGWEFVGYLGTGIKGIGSDETLWRRPD